MAETKTNKKKTIGVYDYRLDLGVNIEDPNKSVTALSLCPQKGEKATIGDTVRTVTLLGVKFTRKIYEPGLIEAEVSLDSVPTIDDANAFFSMRYAELSIIDPNGTTDSDKEKKIAKNYFVFMVNPQIVMNNGKPSMFIKLTINSMDKLMTLDKYSKAYVSRTLGDILDYESRSFGFKDVLFQTNNYYLRRLRYPLKGNAKDLADNSIELKTSLEFIQPYLVQYNETFHDFIVRTANRCGEFLLFEDGTLYLGLPVTNTVESIPTYDTVTFQDFSKNPLNVETYARDSVKKGNGDVKILGLNTGVIKTGRDGFPDDAFPKGLKYNSELAQDEYIYPLYRGKWTNLRHETGFDKITDLPIALVFSMLKNELQNTQTDYILNAIDWGVALATEWGSLAFFALTELYFTNKAKTDEFIDPLKKKKEHYDSLHGVQFSSVNEEGWTTVNYYADIRKYEEQQQKKIICIDMGTNYTDVKLGETIQVEGLTGNYVVIEIRQVSSQMWTRDYKKFDSSDNSTDIYTNRQSQIIYAIPTYKDKDDKERAMPPVAPVSIIRKAGPQTAFVVDNKDPKHQGRVRIAYPWQSSESPKRLDLMQAEIELDAATKSVKAIEDKINEMKYLLDLLTLEKEELKDISTMTDEERKQKKEAVEQEIASIDLLLKSLELPADGSRGSLNIYQYLVRLAQVEKTKRLKKRKEVLEAVLKILNGEQVDLDAEMKKLQDEIDNNNNLLNDAKEEKEKAEKNYNELNNKTDSLAEAWTDELKDIASPWVRVATPMATKGGGTYFKPQVGDEVLVNYDNDNIERPYVVGSLFSKNVPDPDEFLNCTATQSDLLKETTTTIMSPNGHHIAFKDPTEGSAFLSGIQPGVGLLASGINSLAGIDWGKDCTGGIHIGDRYGIYELSMSSHERKINISSPMGDVSIDAFSGITLSAPNGNVKIVGKNVSIEAGNNIEITSGNNIQYPVEGHPKKRYKVTNGIKSAVAGMIGAGVEAAAKYIDMTFVRTMAEVFLRPIEGTNCIKSKRYLMLEAGKGKAHIPQERYAPNEQDNTKAEQTFFNNLMDCVEAVNTRCDGIAKRYKIAWDDAYEKLQAWNDVKYLIKDENKNDIDPLAKGWKYDFKKAWEDVFTAQDFDNKVEEVLQFNDEGFEPYEQTIDRLLQASNACAKAVYQVNRCYSKFLALFDTPVKNPPIPIMDELLKKDFDDAKKTRSGEWVDAYVSTGEDKPTDKFLRDKMDNIDDDPIYHKMKGFKRYLAAAFIADVASKDEYAMPKLGLTALLSDPFAKIGGRGKYLKIHYEKKDLKEERLALPYYWQQFVGNMRKFDTWFARAAADAIITPIQTALQLNQELTNHSDKVYKNIWQQIGDRQVWNDRPDGLILLSDRKDMTKAFESGKWRGSRTENRGNWKYLTEYLLRYMN